jgi:WD40 repeat protein
MKFAATTFFILGMLCVAGLAADNAPGAKEQAISIAELKRTDPVDFEREILPVLKNNCLACHNQTKAKADLILETPQTILKGGESGPAVVPGKSTESLILKVASHQDKPSMPPRENKVAASNLTPEQLGLLKLWIDQGAKGEVRAPAPVDWQRLPDAFNPIYAVALSQDGQLAACSRGNEIFVYHVPSQQLLTRLADPGLTNDPGAAHRDLVQSLAFNPEGTLVVSGSYREVKLWRRQKSGQTLSVANADTNAVNAIAVSPDGKWLATAGADDLVKLWELPSCKPVRSLAGHERAVTTLQFTTNSARLCSGSVDKSVRIWNVADGSLISSTNTPAEVNAVAWLAGDSQLISGHSDNLIRVWQLSDTSSNALTLVKELKGHEGSITSLQPVSRAGHQILSGSTDGTVRQWDAEKGEAVRVMKHDAPITAVAVRPDGKRFASASANNTAKLWNAEDGKLVTELKGDRYTQEAAAEVERCLAVANSDVAYRKSGVESAEKQNQTQTDRLKKGEEAFATADKTFNEKKQALTSATDTKNTAEKTLVDLNAEIKKVTDDFTEADKTAKQATVEAKAAAEKATQTKLAADQSAQTKIQTEKVAADATAIAARAKDGAGTNTAGMAVEAEAVAAKARAFAESVAADAAAKVKLAEEMKIAAEKAIDAVASRSLVAGELRAAYVRTTNSAPQRLKEATDKLTSATNAFVAAEKEFKKAELVRSTADNELQLAKNAAKQASESLAAAKAALQEAEKDQKTKDAAVQTAKKSAADSEKPIRALSFSPDNLTLATGGDDHLIHTWSAETGAAFEVYKGHTGIVACITFLSANQIASSGSDRNVMMWNLNSAWALERRLGTGDGASPIVDRVMAVRFSRDGQRLATGSGEPSRSGEIKIWQIADGKLLSDLKNIHSDSVLCLDFSPNDQYLASGAADKFARVIEVATGKIVKAFEGHTHHVLGVSWKRDGRSLATAGADNVVKVWDFTTGERRKNIEGFNKEVASINFIGVTDQALTTSGDSQVRIVRENGDNVRTFTGAADYMYSGSATPDGKIVVAGGQDSVLRVWNGADGNLMVSFPAPAK